MKASPEDLGAAAQAIRYFPRGSRAFARQDTNLVLKKVLFKNLHILDEL